MIPAKIFFTKGVGVHKDRLASFELALRNAGIEKCNLVYVSSIFPPNCRMINKEEGLKLLKPGQITFCVMARSETSEPNRLVSAAIGVAVPKTAIIMAICQSIMLLARLMKNQGNMQRTWQQQCLPQHLE